MPSTHPSLSFPIPLSFPSAPPVQPLSHPTSGILKQDQLYLRFSPSQTISWGPSLSRAAAAVRLKLGAVAARSSPLIQYEHAGMRCICTSQPPPVKHICKPTGGAIELGAHSAVHPSLASSIRLRKVFSGLPGLLCSTAAGCEHQGLVGRNVPSYAQPYCDIYSPLTRI